MFLPHFNVTNDNVGNVEDTKAKNKDLCSIS